MKNSNKLLPTAFIGIMIIGIAILLTPRADQHSCLYYEDMTQLLQDNYEIDLDCVERKYGLPEPDEYNGSVD